MNEIILRRSKHSLAHSTRWPDGRLINTFLLRLLLLLHAWPCVVRFAKHTSQLLFQLIRIRNIRSHHTSLCETLSIQKEMKRKKENSNTIRNVCVCPLSRSLSFARSRCPNRTRNRKKKTKRKKNRTPAILSLLFSICWRTMCDYCLSYQIRCENLWFWSLKLISRTSEKQQNVMCIYCMCFMLLLLLLVLPFFLRKSRRLFTVNYCI